MMTGVTVGGKACSPLATAYYVWTLTQKLINVNLFTSFNLRKPFCSCSLVLFLCCHYISLSWALRSLAPSWLASQWDLSFRHSAHDFTYHFSFMRAIGCWIPWGAVVMLLIRLYLSSFLLCSASVSSHSCFLQLEGITLRLYVVVQSCSCDFIVWGLTACRCSNIATRYPPHNWAR